MSAVDPAQGTVVGGSRPDAPDRVLPVVQTVGLVYGAAVLELVRRKRLVFLGLALLLPLLLTVVWRIYGMDHLDATRFFANLGGMIYLKALVYLVSLFYGVPAVHDEIEGHTLVYLFTRPLSKMAIFVGRLLAVQTVAGLLLAASLAVCFLLMIVGNTAAIDLEFIEVYTNYFLVVLLAVFCYTAVFALMGTAFKKPLVWGVLYIFAWETSVSVIPARLQMWTLEWHLRNLILHQQDVTASLNRFVLQFLSVDYAMPWWGSLAILLAALSIFTLAGGWVFSRKEYLLG